MILVADPKKPFPRAPKGTVVRKQALALYTDAVENLCVAYDFFYVVPNSSCFLRYKAVEQSAAATGVGAPSSWNIDDIQPWLREQAAGLLDDVSLNISRDLFEQGFDRCVHISPS